MKFFLVIVVATATYFDLKNRKIPNWLTYPALALLLFQLDSFVVFSTILALLISLLFGKYIGAGDIKLGLVIACWSHVFSWSQNWLVISLFVGGLWGLIFIRKSLPFAPFLASGVVLANVARGMGIF